MTTETHSTPCLLVIDGMNILRRCYEANPAPDSEEKAKGAARSAFSSFRRALVEHKPTHAVAPFDHGGATWRHALYPLYKEKRKPMPEVLRDEIPAFRQRLTEELGLVTLCPEGVEADDVIGAVTQKWIQSKNTSCIALSTDKDIAQLIAQGVRVRDHFKPEWRDDAWVRAKFGVPAELLGDMLALIGDTSDGVPGVEDVGPKTAAKWLLKYGNLDAVLAAAPEITGKVGERLRAQADQARLSRQLVAFKTDMTLGITWNGIQVPSYE